MYYEFEALLEAPVTNGVRPELSELQILFRDAMAAVASPVSVVTAHQDGRPHGATVSAFSSLSLHPPMVLVSLDQASRLLAMVRTTGKFGLNVLGTGQYGLCGAFASRDADKFGGVQWELDRTVPRLHGVVSWLACDVDRLVSAGDHVVVLGNVRKVINLGGAPLTYHLRTLGTHAPLAQSRSRAASVRESEASGASS